MLALGRDPFFPAWPDVVQLNAFSPELRAAVVETLRAIADQCDGVRCDMAMLVMNDTFAKTWDDRGGERPADDYWPTVISAVRQTHPDFRFLAEAYWDLEWELQQQGLDFCYDKRLYDRLMQRGRRTGTPPPARRRLLPGPPRPVHREPRRTAGRVHSRSGPGEGGRGRDAHPDRRPTGPRRSDRRPQGAPADVPRPVPRRAGRERAGDLLRHPPHRV